ncbi:hypothetical protein CLV30_103222 [Haloactinopolyspora alba]|uniref:Uncharacterized protein n=1 Tax=Haloactinopolyspora alba TaxID=648780 RepID=A0A2P8E9H3_9ACTN|nr:hypothetical protein [Haloactinopolyspora alba]PSL06067.1 hypothetical protein CLV30_103222 [Haloactinopolyspora alba]
MATRTTREKRRPGQGAVGAGVTAIVLVLSACGGDENDPVAEPTGSGTPSPALTAPPTTTPEEKAEAEIKATFKTLIANRDEFYSNASDYSVNEVQANAPSTEWNVTGQADLELSNWTRSWRTATELEQIGDTIIARHEVTNIDLNVTDSGIHEATTTACMNMTTLTFETYDGQPADDSFEPDKYQTWTMNWTYFPNAGPDEGEDPGWYIQTIDLTRNRPC